MSLQKENSVSMTAEPEELDYEGDDANSPIKKHNPTIEKKRDLEEGEILDSNDELCVKKRMCNFFQRGECRLGDKCTGLHVADCLYKMIDSSPAVPSESQNGYQGTKPHANISNPFSMINPSSAFSPTFQNPCSTVNLQTNNFNLDNYEQCEMDTAWDRDLKEAKKLVKDFDNKTNRKSSPVTVTVESENERLSDKSSKKPRRYRSPSPKRLLRDSSLSDVEILPQQKLVNCKNDWQRANKWHDPWRRSPVHLTKSFPSSADSIRSFRSPHRRKPDHLSISGKQHCKISRNRNKCIRRRSLSSSSSSPIHRTRKESSKPIQKESVSPIKVTKLKSAISKQELPEIAKKRDKTNLHLYSTFSNRASIHRSIKENLKILQEKKYAAVENKSNRHLELSDSDRRARKIVENWDRTVYRRSSSSSSQESIRRSIKDIWNTIQEKKARIGGNKRDKRVKFSDRRSRKIAENGHKATSHRSSTSSSPPSVYHCRKTEMQASNLENKVSPIVLDRNSKSNERVKEKFPSSSVASDCRLNDVGRWTPKKVGPPTPTMKSCSDMSISPLTDSSLSEIFDPYKKENKDKTYRHEASRFRSFQPTKKCRAEVYGPICPPKIQIVAPNISETKSKIIQNNKSDIANLSGTKKVIANSPACSPKNKAVDVSKSKQRKQRKFSRNLEADLFKFHRDSFLSDDGQQESTKHRETSLLNDVLQKSTEIEISKTPKKNSPSKKMPETQINQMKEETSLIQRNQRFRKDEILQQLEAINAAIERKRTTMHVL